MTSSEIRARFLEFFQKRGHSIIPSASLVTSDEKGVTNPTLFNTAGMQPLIPYLLGKPYVIDSHEVTRLADVQKCLRTVDIDDIGDKTHATFFEMLGNWSLGDYFKKEAIEWSYELLTSKSDVPGDRGFGLDPNRLYVTVFEGDTNAKRDDEAADIWREVFKKNGVTDASGDSLKGQTGRIFYMPADMNWWEAGENGPCGPDTEMYYDIGDPKTGKPYFGGKGIIKEQFIEADSKRQVVEVWNDVFMQYEKKDGKIIGNLPKPSVDTGAGLERLAMALATPPVDNIYDTDLLKPVMDKIREYSKNWEFRSARIVADHMRAAAFMVADGIIPDKNGRGYVLRKIIRRAVVYSDKLQMNKEQQISSALVPLVGIIQTIYSGVYKLMSVDNGESIRRIIADEEINFRITLKQGLREFEKGVDAFTLFSSYGFPLELTLELAKEKGINIDTKDFDAKFKAHQALSRSGASQKFKGGLADANDPMVVRYHTATHLLHQALHDVLGDGVMQKGSNITTERLRFDFTYGAKMTDDEKKKVENIVNEKIAAALPMNQIIMPRAEAEKTGARHFFAEKYGDEISVYFIGPASNPPVVEDLVKAYSKEFCGGPHVKNTSELAGPEGKWHFKIQKEEAVAQGVRRIKAVLS
jgi:alanyl-tRNA synthetase